MTWCDGTKSTTGAISPANSLIGTISTNPNIIVADEVGIGGVTALSNGNYVVSSPLWRDQSGAVTLCDGTKRTSAVVSAVNSLVGSPRTGGFFDSVGGGSYSFGAGNAVPIGGVTALPNGNYVVDSPNWDGNTGAVTLGIGTTAISGTVGPGNSLVGSYSGDFVGVQGVTVLSTGNYVVDSPLWNNSLGAVTWVDGTKPTNSTVSTANSLVGNAAGDQVGGGGLAMSINGTLHTDGGVNVLPNGNYVVLSPHPSEGSAATWSSGTKPTVGAISTANSLVTAHVRSTGAFAITVLPNSDFVVADVPGGTDGYFETWVDGTTGTTWDGQNTPEAQNSFYGGGGAVIPLPTAGGAFIKTEQYNSGEVGTVGTVVTNPNDLTYSFRPGTTVTVSPDLLTRVLDEGTDVTVQANDDITIDSPITESPTGNAGDLTLETGRTILINSSIGTAGGNLSLIANDTVADGVINSERDPGDADITMNSAPRSTRVQGQ